MRQRVQRTGNRTPGGAAVTIVIKNFKFVPAAPHVRSGQRVEVKNGDAVVFTLTAAAANGRFNTGTISPGHAESFTVPAKSGTYSFHCSFHPFMTGTLIVGNVSAAAMLAAARANLPRPSTFCGLPPAWQAVSSRGGAPRLLTAVTPGRP